MVVIQNRSLVQLFDGIAHLWFLLILAECCIVFSLMDKVFMAYKNNIVLFILTFLYLAIDSKIKLSVNVAGLGIFIHYFPYYLVGILVHQLKFERFVTSKTVYMLPLVCAAYIVSVRVGLLANCISMLFIGLVFLLTKNLSEEYKLLKTIDKSSMGIYILHQPLMQELSLLPFISAFRDDHYYLYPVLMFAFVLVLSHAIIYVTRQVKIDRFIFG